MACLGKAMGYIVGEKKYFYIEFHFLTKDITW